MRTAPSAGSPALGDCVLHDKRRQHETHITSIFEVVYPWHPWYGQRVGISQSRGKNLNVFRCQGPQVHLLEIPQWMFDRARCCTMRLAPSSLVRVDALRQVQHLLRQSTGGAHLVQDQHRPSRKKGDADVEPAPLPEQQPTGPVFALPRPTDLAQPSCSGQAPSQRVTRASALRASHSTDCARGAQGGVT